MKLNFSVSDKNHPDPFIFEDGDKFYLYVTGGKGVEAYVTEDIFGTWDYVGIVTDFSEGHNFWAPAVIKYEGKYYLYVSCEIGEDFQFMHVAESDSPTGPFRNEKRLYDEFSIDAHTVQTEDGLFLWYAANNRQGEKIGTRIFVDKLLDPYTPAKQPKEVLIPTFREELQPYCCTDEYDWYTLEGPFWFQEGEWQYVMYSGGCYADDSYHIGYGAAKTNETDLTKIDFVKHTKDGAFDPVMLKNDYEEGTGHHSVIKYKGDYYAIYHGRDYRRQDDTEYVERRTARICRLHVSNGIITAERYPDRL